VKKPKFKLKKNTLYGFGLDSKIEASRLLAPYV